MVAQQYMESSVLSSNVMSAGPSYMGTIMPAPVSAVPWYMQIWNFFTSGWTPLIMIILMAIMMYQVYKNFKNERSELGTWFGLGLLGASIWLVWLQFNGWFGAIFTLLSVFLIIEANSWGGKEANYEEEDEDDEDEETENPKKQRITAQVDTGYDIYQPPKINIF